MLFHRTRTECSQSRPPRASRLSGATNQQNHPVAPARISRFTSRKFFYCLRLREFPSVRLWVARQESRRNGAEPAELKNLKILLPLPCGNFRAGRDPPPESFQIVRRIRSSRGSRMGEGNLRPSRKPHSPNIISPSWLPSCLLSSGSAEFRKRSRVSSTPPSLRVSASSPERRSAATTASGETRRKIIKIAVRTNDDEAVSPGALPDLVIGARPQPKFGHMNQPRVQLRQPYGQLPGKVLVEQQLHNATRFPIRAANS